LSAESGAAFEERDLVLRAQRGDPRAFEEIVRAYQDIAFRVAYLVAGDAAEAEDAAQEGLVKAWRALGRFRAGEPVRPWLLRIVANEARNRRRSAGRRARLQLRAEREGTSGDAAPSPEGEALAGIERGRLLAAIDGLPDQFRLVVACRYLLDLSEEETAAALDLRRGTVKSRTARALDRLKETYEPA
jgi:RNA polymerase sigma factor (sigma-70 family)